MIAAMLTIMKRGILEIVLENTTSDRRMISKDNSLNILAVRDTARLAAGKVKKLKEQTTNSL